MPIFGTGIIPDDLAYVSRRAFTPQLLVKINTQWADYSGNFTPAVPELKPHPIDHECDRCGGQRADGRGYCWYCKADLR
jgi:hypothetical protein